MSTYHYHVIFYQLLFLNNVLPENVYQDISQSETESGEKARWITHYTEVNGFHVDNDFVQHVQDLLWKKVDWGVHNQGDFNLNSSHLNDYKFFQMLFALSSEDPVYSICTIELVLRDPPRRILEWKDWLESNLKIRNLINFYKSVRFYSILTSKIGDYFKPVTHLVLEVAERFSVLDEIFNADDGETLHWILSSGYTLEKIKGNLVEEAWKNNKYNVIDEVLKSNGIKSRLLVGAMINLVTDDKYIEFLVANQSDDTNIYACQNYISSYEIFIRLCLKYNKLFTLKNCSKNLEIGDSLDWKLIVDKPLLIDMIENNKLDSLHVMLNLGFPINFYDEDGLTIFFRALHYNNSLMIGAISNVGGGNANQTTVCGKTLLHLAVEQSLLHVAETLITIGAELETKDCTGQTPLHKAVIYYDYKFLRELMKKYMSVGSPSVQEILHFAAGNGSSEAVQGLVSMGFNVNAIDSRGSTPLDLAIASCRSNNSLILLERGAKLNQTVSAQDYIKAIIRCGDVRALAYMAENMFSLEELIIDEVMLLNMAVKNRNHDILRLLMKNGLNPNAGISSAEQPILEAVKNDDVESLDILLSFGASLEFPSTMNGISATDNTILLHEAAVTDSPNAVRWLLNHDRPVDEKDREGNTPLILASKSGNDRVVKELLNGGAAVNGRNEEGTTALHEAAKEGHFTVVRELLNLGAEPKLKDKLLRQTALHWAAYFGRQSVLMELLDRGSEIESTNKIGNTALHIAADVGKYPIVMELVERGANINPRNQFGQTPLFYAQKGHHESIVKSLTLRGGMT